MALSTEIILTLQSLKEVGVKGFGTKTILDIAKSSSNLFRLDELIQNWTNFKGKKFQSVCEDDLKAANVIAKRIACRCEAEEVGIISYFDPVFPDMLRHCINEQGKEEPAIVLYYRGNLQVLNEMGIAVIGTREPTENGVLAGRYFSSKFAEAGFNIVSGLAIGCDTTGHEGALSVSGGMTTAILANGLDWKSIYPKENLDLAKRIVESGGLLLSEYPVGQACNRYGLVARDRLQAGLSKMTLVVQTGISGGTMHAVNATISAGKLLYAVNYKQAQDLSNEKVQGNLMLVDTGKATALSSENLSSVIEKSKSMIGISKSDEMIVEKGLFD